jgi:hypothetical protein
MLRRSCAVRERVVSSRDPFFASHALPPRRLPESLDYFNAPFQCMTSMHYGTCRQNVFARVDQVFQKKGLGTELFR